MRAGILNEAGLEVSSELVFLMVLDGRLVQSWYSLWSWSGGYFRAGILNGAGLISKRHQQFSKIQFWSVYAHNIVSAKNRIHQKDIAAQ